MKRFDLLLITGLFALLQVGTSAQTITLVTTDGQSFKQDLVSNILFTNNNIVFESDDGEKDYYSIFFTRRMSYEETVISVPEIEYESEISVFPNPVSSTLTVSLVQMNSKPVAIIYNISGSILKRFQLYQMQNEVDVSDLAPGMYLISVNNQTFKFIKK